MLLNLKKFSGYEFCQVDFPYIFRGQTFSFFQKSFSHPHPNQASRANPMLNGKAATVQKAVLKKISSVLSFEAIMPPRARIARGRPSHLKTKAEAISSSCGGQASMPKAFAFLKKSVHAASLDSGLQWRTWLPAP